MEIENWFAFAQVWNFHECSRYRFRQCPHGGFQQTTSGIPDGGAEGKFDSFSPLFRTSSGPHGPPH